MKLSVYIHVYLWKESGYNYHLNHNLNHIINIITNITMMQIFSFLCVSVCGQDIL